ncbi:hypothetical protein Tco_1467437 [Tanacetum coccineum]
MTRSSMNELFTPYKDPEQEFRSSRRHFKTLSLDELRSPGVARPKIDDKDQFELNGQFLKELRENIFSGSDNEDANEHIGKVLEIEVILFYNGLDVPTRQILDSRGAIPTKTAEDAKKAIQEMAKYSQK